MIRTPIDPSKILVIGCSGSGKSTLSKLLANELNLPVLHLDQVWHKTNYDEEGKKHLVDTQHKFVSDNECFIIDGNYSWALNARIPHATLIIWLKVPRRVSLTRVLKRTVLNNVGLKKRTDMADNFKEKFNRDYFEFLKFVYTFEKKFTPEMENLLKSKNPNTTLVIIRNRREMKAFLELGLENK